MIYKELVNWLMLAEYKKITNKNKIELLHNYENINEICSILNLNQEEKIDKYIKYMQEKNIQVITYYDKDYPKQLKNLYDAHNCNDLKRSSITMSLCTCNNSSRTRAIGAFVSIFTTILRINNVCTRATGGLSGPSTRFPKIALNLPAIVCAIKSSKVSLRFFRYTYTNR